MIGGETAVSAGPPPSGDPHDPMPEGRFVYCRVRTYAIADFGLFFCWGFIAALFAAGADQSTDAIDALVTQRKALRDAPGLIVKAVDAGQRPETIPFPAAPIKDFLVGEADEGGRGASTPRTAGLTPAPRAAAAAFSSPGLRGGGS